MTTQIIYYRASDKQKVNNLPYFFGWAEIVDDKINGEHYKPKQEKDSDSYSIGFYKIEGITANFLNTLQMNTILEINRQEYENILEQWLQVSEYPLTCWGQGWEWQVARPIQ